MVRPLRVVVDARINALDGIGRYTRGLVTGLRRLARPDLDLRVLEPTGVRRYSRAEEKELIAFAEDQGADVVHLCNYRVPLAPLPAPAVVTMHDTAYLTNPHLCFGDEDFARYFGPDGLAELRDSVTALQGLGNPAPLPGASLHAAYVRGMLHHAVRRADAVVVPTGVLAAEVTGLAPDGPPVTVSPWGLDHLGPARTRLPAALAGQPYALFVSVARPYKGLTELAAAYARTHAHRAGVRLALAGARCEPGGPAAEAFTAAGVAPVWLGEVDDARLAALYRGARVLVHPSRHESFGFPPLEALSLGCPVVANDLPALREVLGRHAAFVDVRDSAAFARAIDTAVAGPPSGPAHGVRHARRLTWRRHAMDMARLYPTVAGRI